MEYILGDKAISAEVEKIKEHQERENRKNRRALERKQSTWVPLLLGRSEKAQTALNLTAATKRPSAKDGGYDKFSDVFREKKAVLDLIKEHTPEKLFDDYLNKVRKTVTDDLKAQLPEDSELQGGDAVVQRVVEDRVNHRLLEGGLKNIWFLYEPATEGGGRFAYHDVHRHVDRSLPAGVRTTADINAELAADKYADSWLRNIEFRQGKYGFRDRSQVFEEEKAMKLAGCSERETSSRLSVLGEPFEKYYSPLSLSWELEAGERSVASWLEGNLSLLPPSKEAKKSRCCFKASESREPDERDQELLYLQESLFSATTESLRLLVLKERADEKNKENEEEGEEGEKNDEEEEEEDEKASAGRGGAALPRSSASPAAGGRGAASDAPDNLGSEVDIEMGRTPARDRERDRDKNRDRRREKEEGLPQDAPRRLPVDASAEISSRVKVSAAGGGKRETENPFRQSQHFREPGAQGDWVNKVSRSNGRQYWANERTGERTYNDPFGKGKDKDKERERHNERDKEKDREKEREKDKDRRRREKEKGGKEASPAMHMGDLYPPEKEHAGSHAAAAAVNAVEKAEKAEKRARERERERDRDREKEKPREKEKEKERDRGAQRHHRHHHSKGDPERSATAPAGKHR